MRMSEHEDRAIEMIQSEHKRKNGQSFRDLGNSKKRFKICVTQVLKGEENECEAENLFKEIMDENFPHLAINLN